MVEAAPRRLSGAVQLQMPHRIGEDLEDLVRRSADPLRYGNGLALIVVMVVPSAAASALWLAPRMDDDRPRPRWTSRRRRRSQIGEPVGSVTHGTSARQTFRARCGAA